MIKFPIKLFYISILPSAILYIVTLYISNIYNIKLSLVVRDLAQTCGYPIGVGMISNIGILLWGAAASICLFTTFSQEINSDSSKLLLLGGVFSGLLCIDDFFLLHDRYLGPDFLNLTYLSISIFLFVRFRKILKRIGLFNLVISILFLGLSIFFDGVIQQIFNQSYDLTQLIEEGFKFLGIACWLNFWCKASYYSLKFCKS
ncbi:hypothetical protein EU96_1413 [Prochlorococcus marinus str. MIT 9302]|uniref:DUF998 domain-containing protein n=1 Tax=Prochlorococcus marinus str. MIT 9302 TaxID=74545 RepID=A0A0A2A4G6_PROMR|nr:hypothetical protein [Prochlorococcus marinus]KGF96777.1 hypothetical protein EU96_1413 [Prochlorococcus marinus str. MIT 9302]